MTTQKRDYYEVLGVSRNATEDDLKKSLRGLEFEYNNDIKNIQELRSHSYDSQKQYYADASVNYI